MAPTPESPTIEWRDDAKPLALCMMCDTEFPTQETRCPRCQSALSLVHRCPGCTRVVSAKHLRCPYCSQTFLKDGDSSASRRGQEDAVSAARRQLNDARLRGQGRRALWFSAAVFLTVFLLAVALQRYRPAADVAPGVLGTSFVLREAVLRESGSSLSPAVGKLTPPAVVEITGTEQDAQGRNWFQIQRGQGTAYLPVSLVAPPKGNDADGGYKLLRISLLDLSDPAVLADAASAVKLYRNRYPLDTRGEELLWLLAEKGRELGVRRRDSKALAAARSAYSEISRGRGQRAPGAEAALAQLGESPAAGPPEAAKPSNSEAGGAAAGGPGSWGVYDDKTRARKVMLLDRTEVAVVLSSKQLLKDGEVLTGQIARAVVSNGETAIPAGSPCRVKVSARNDSGKISIELSLVEIQIGGKGYPVEAAPVRLGPNQSLGRSRLSFRLRQTLILAQ